MISSKARQNCSSTRPLGRPWDAICPALIAPSLHFRTSGNACFLGESNAGLAVMSNPRG